MARTLLQMRGIPHETIVVGDGVPYRAGPDGIIHAELNHVEELLARGYTLVEGGKKAGPLAPKALAENYNHGG